MNKTAFDWQADEDESLGDSPHLARKGRSSWWPAVGFILIIVVGISLTGWLLDRRQRRLEDDVQQNVRLNFDLWWQALQENDRELHVHMLSLADRQWWFDQVRLFDADLILGRSFWGLSRLDEVIAAPQIDLAPDWQQAIVSFEQDYAAPQDAVNPDVVRLLHTAVFDLQDANWRQIPPDQKFWGDWAAVESDILVMRYPARDADLALRISRQLEADLHAVCAVEDGPETGAGDKCKPLKPITLQMSTAVKSLAALNKAEGPLLARSTFEMPAPTLIGLPMDEVSFQAFYRGYTGRLLEQVRTAVNSPIPLPEQVIRALCFNHPQRGMRLHKYDPASGAWEAELPERRFRSLETLPEEQGLILDEAGGDRQSWQSRLILRQKGSEKILLEEAEIETPYRMIMPADTAASHLLLRRFADDQAAYRYRALDLRSCAAAECDQMELPGYALWSPGSEQTLLQIDAEIYFGDASGLIETSLGSGFNPFWLDDETAAYIQFSTQDLGTVNQLVSVETASGKERILFDTQDLAEQAGTAGDELSIKYVMLNPGDPGELLVHASGLRTHAGEYFIFTVRLPEDLLPGSDAEIFLELQRVGSPSIDAYQVTPSGYLPFSPSADGRWLLISELTGYDTATRSYLLHDLQQNKTMIISENVPVFPAQFPTYDWSDDGRWLVVAEDGFLRLLAPEFGYEQLLAHDFDSCFFIRWSD